MRLTALCVCGTLLTFLNLSWTTADSGGGDLLEDQVFGPCTATLRPWGLCRQGQDENTCPYLISLPPMTVHLPKQLRELEKIMKDLQKLKDNVDELRKMCADCTVSQNERECGRQREREHENLNVCKDGDDKNWMNERNPEQQKDFRQGCGADGVKMEKTMERDGDTGPDKITIEQEREIEKWEAEKESDQGNAEENEKEKTLKEGTQKGGKTQTEWAKRKSKVGQAKVPAAGGKKTTGDIVRERIVENNRHRKTDTDKNKEKDRKLYSKGDQDDKLEREKERKMTTNIKNREKAPESDPHMRQDKTKEREKSTHNEEDIRASDGIKMSEDQDEHTNKHREQHSEDREKEMDKGIKAEHNNEKPKQTENIGHAGKEKTIKEAEVEEEDRETGKEIKSEGEKTVQSVQRHSDGELTSSKALERTDFVSISTTPQSAISLAQRHESMDSNQVTTITSSPPLSSSPSHVSTDVNHGTMIAAFGLPTRITGPGPTGTSEHQSPDGDTGFRTTNSPTAPDTISTLGGLRQQTNSATTRFTSTTGVRPGAGFQGQLSSTTTTSTPILNLYTATFPEVLDHSMWTAKRNISSNTKPGVIPRPGPGPKPHEKHKPGINPETEQKLKNPNKDHKPDRTLLPDKKTKHDQKQKPSHQRPTTNQKTKSDKDNKPLPISKPDQRAPTDNFTSDQNLENNQMPKHDQTSTTNQLPVQKPHSQQKSVFPVQRPTSQQRPATVNATGSDKDPSTDQQSESVGIRIINQNSKLDIQKHHPFRTDRPDQKQKPDKTTKSEKKKPDPRSEPNQHLTHVQESESERSGTTILTPKPKQKPVTELMGNSDESLSPEPKSNQDSTPGQKLDPDHDNIHPDQKPKLNLKIPRITQNPKPGHIPNPSQKHPVHMTGQRTKPNIKPTPGQAPQANPRLKTQKPDQMTNLNPKSETDESPEEESNKRVKPKSPLSHRQSTRPVLKPGATPAQRPKPAVQSKPSAKTKTDLDLPHISMTTSNSIQNSQTNMPPTSGPLIDVTHSPVDTKLSPSTMTLHPKTDNSLTPGPFPHLHTLAEGFTTSPNSRITSDLRPQTVGQLSSIPTTTIPNTITRRILPSVFPSTSPGSTKPNIASNTDSSLQAKILHNVKETAHRQTPEPDKMMVPAPSPSALTTSTVSPDVRSKTPGSKAPAPESSTPSAHELRVKINQVAAFLNNSLSLNGRSQDNHGGSRPGRTDNKQPPLTPAKVTIATRDCSEHLLRGATKSGVYLVTPDTRSRGFPVLCDMELGGGGWTLLQRRADGSVSFNRSWAEYRSGFGELHGGEFWLGNDKIHLLTRDRAMVLRVELEDFDGVTEYAQYEQFRVAGERLRYRLTVGGYSGTAGDALRFSRSYDHNNRAFTTPDRDHDRYPSGNCGAYYSSGWWFDACMAANLNGKYYAKRYKGIRDGIFWGTWKNQSTEYYPTSDRQSFKAVRMMIRPKGFAP
ncbi:uncharacterized protein LOC113133214 [Mastacembelus armatus]|uniref:Uncharacterized LOC113133214 n=1 Tax=Mastacembelus armatus TaxID=205130 RepID=A0A3Q3LMN9_9TELE|nr:uncharacterized protein LOC113133214 [Mastacembelus armatus]